MSGLNCFGPLSPASVVGQLAADCLDSWEAYTGHAFVRGVRDGSLPHAAFRHYLIQDYLFLIQFTRAYALAVYKSDDLTEMQEASNTVHALLNTEMGLHVSYCEQWGITGSQMLATPEAAATTSYTRYVLDAGMAGDLLDLLVALAPCSCGYGEIGAWLAGDPATVLAGNPYREWIELYGGDDFQQVSRSAVAQIDRVAAARVGDEPRRSPRWDALCRNFRRAVELETAFWQMGLEQQP